MKCNKTLADCECPDIKERLAKLSKCPLLHSTLTRVPLAQIAVREEQERNRPGSKPEDN